MLTTQPSDLKVKVLVIGSGSTGLGAARRLQEVGETQNNDLESQFCGD